MSVDTRVRASRDGEAVPGAVDAIERRAELALHGSKPRLRGPAGELRAIVCEGQLDNAHRKCMLTVSYGLRRGDSRAGRSYAAHGVRAPPRRPATSRRDRAGPPRLAPGRLAAPPRPQRSRTRPRAPRGDAQLLKRRRRR